MINLNPNDIATVLLSNLMTLQALSKKDEPAGKSVDLQFPGHQAVMLKTAPDGVVGEGFHSVAPTVGSAKNLSFKQVRAMHQVFTANGEDLKRTSETLSVHAGKGDMSVDDIRPLLAWLADVSQKLASPAEEKTRVELPEGAERVGGS